MNVSQATVYRNWEVTATDRWDETAISCLHAVESSVDLVVRKILNGISHQIGSSIEATRAFIEARFSDLGKFNDWFNAWLDDNGQGDWYWQLATILYKLPMRHVRDLVELLYQIVKTCTTLALQPHKIPTQVAILLIAFASALVQPETWSQMGAGTIGTSLGQAAVGNPFSVIGFGIGVAMLVGGVSVGTLKTAIEAESGSKLQDVQQYLQKQAVQLSVRGLQSFTLGLILGGIEKACRRMQQSVWEKQKETFIPAEAEAREFATRFCKEHNLPLSSVSLGNDGKISIQFASLNNYDLRTFMYKRPDSSGAALTFVRQKFPEFSPSVPGRDDLTKVIEKVQLELSRKQATVTVSTDTFLHEIIQVHDGEYNLDFSYDRYHYKASNDNFFPLSDITGPHGASYPMPPQPFVKELDLFNSHVATIGCAHAFKKEAPRMQNWAILAISYLSKTEAQIDTLFHLAAGKLRTIFEQTVHYIKRMLEQFEELHGWLHKYENGTWYLQLATYLYKLPLQVVYNIVHLLVTSIKTALQTAIEPHKIPTQLAKLLVTLVHAATQPQTWAQMGCGLLGASSGQALVTGNPLTLIGGAVGAALAIGGVSVDLLLTALRAEKDLRLQKVFERVMYLATALTEVTATGFCMGLMIGAIQRYYSDLQRASWRATSYEEAKAHAEAFIKEHNLPPYKTVRLSPSGSIEIIWDNPVEKLFPSLNNKGFVPSHDSEGVGQLDLRHPQKITQYTDSPLYEQQLWESDYIACWPKNYTKNLFSMVLDPQSPTCKTLRFEVADWPLWPGRDNGNFPRIRQHASTASAPIYTLGEEYAGRVYPIPPSTPVDAACDAVSVASGVTSGVTSGILASRRK